MTSNFTLTNRALKLSEIPDEDTLITAGQKLLDSRPEWKQGKSYEGEKVKSFSRERDSKDVSPWHSRLSEHARNEATFDDFWEYLGNVRTKSEHEKGFTKEIKKVTLVKEISPTQAILTLYYEFPQPGVSPRVFTVLQCARLNSASPRSGIVVSVPIDLSDDAELAKLEERGVKGRYAAVERLSEIEDGRTLWDMATSSTPGGSIPAFIAERSIPSSIAADVTRFLHYVNKVRPQPSATQVSVPTATRQAAPPAPALSPNI